MARSRLRTGLLAIGSAILGLSVSSGRAGEVDRSEKADEAAMFRNAILNRYDTNHNGRLDSKEKVVALRELTGRNTSDEDLNVLKEQVLARFDKNGNGRLERSEVRTALATVNTKRPSATTEQPASASTATPAQRRRVATAIRNDPTAAVAFTAQQLTSNGVEPEMAQALAIQRFDLNGDGFLDSSELALAQSLLLQQLAQASTTSTVLTPSTLLSSASTGTTSTGTTSTGTTRGSTTGSCMSGSSGSSSGTTGTGSTSAGTTNSALQAANNQGLNSFANAFGRARGFGGGRGR
jgi:Ca2+-binding EF-hand superfamily protein